MSSNRPRLGIQLPLRRGDETVQETDRSLLQSGEDRIAAHIPLRRLGLPDDIATAALFLASDAASWVTAADVRR